MFLIWPILIYNASCCIFIVCLESRRILPDQFIHRILCLLQLRPGNQLFFVGGGGGFECVHKPSTLTNLRKCTIAMDWKTIQSFV